MQYLVLNSYLKMKEDEKNSWKTFIKNLNLIEKILIITMFSSGIISIFLLLYKKEKYISFAYIGILIELLSVLLLSYLSEKERIKKSSDNIKKQDEKYSQIRTWLKDIGYTEKNQIKLLIIRCKSRIEKNDIINEKRKKIIDKTINVTLIPLLAAFVSNVFGKVGNLNEMVVLVILLSLIIIIIIITIAGIFISISPFINKTYIDMMNMVDMIEGMLDREFPVTDDDIKHYI